VQHLSASAQPAAAAVPPSTPVGGTETEASGVVEPVHTGATQPEVFTQAEYVCRQVMQVASVMNWLVQLVSQVVAVLSQGHAAWHFKKVVHAPAYVPLA
jgi:hypothetical protein